MWRKISPPPAKLQLDIHWLGVFKWTLASSGSQRTPDRWLMQEMFAVTNLGIVIILRLVAMAQVIASWCQTKPELTKKMNRNITMWTFGPLAKRGIILPKLDSTVYGKLRRSCIAINTNQVQPYVAQGVPIADIGVQYECNVLTSSQPKRSSRSNRSIHIHVYQSSLLFCFHYLWAIIILSQLYTMFPKKLLFHSQWPEWLIWPSRSQVDKCLHPNTRLKSDT